METTNLTLSPRSKQPVKGHKFDNSKNFSGEKPFRPTVFIRCYIPVLVSLFQFFERFEQQHSGVCPSAYIQQQPVQFNVKIGHRKGDSG
jgi:hypothetical protein